jgi:hypothetical protein
VTRKGEIGRARLARRWPYHIALPAEAVCGSANSETVTGFAGSLSVAPRTDDLARHDNDLVVFCFAKQEDAQVFAERFGGEVVPK